jgi:hypothetical protein
VIETRFLVRSTCNLDAKPNAPSLLSSSWGMNGVGVGGGGGEHVA